MRAVLLLVVGFCLPWASIYLACFLIPFLSLRGCGVSTCCVCSGCTDPGNGIHITVVLTGITTKPDPVDNCDCTPGNTTYAITANGLGIAPGTCMKGFASLGNSCPTHGWPLNNSVHHGASGPSSPTSTVLATDSGSSGATFVYSSSPPYDCTVANGPFGMTVSGVANSGKCDYTLAAATIQYGP